jgi:excisionase family DNA binding protein
MRAETKTMAESWLTTNQAAELVNFHPDHVRRLIRGGLVKAEKFGPVWKVDQQSLLAYVRKMEKQGERRGPKRL